MWSRADHIHGRRTQSTTTLCGHQNSIFYEFSAKPCHGGWCPEAELNSLESGTAPFPSTFIGVERFPKILYIEISVARGLLGRFTYVLSPLLQYITAISFHHIRITFPAGLFLVKGMFREVCCFVLPLPFSLRQPRLSLVGSCNGSYRPMQQRQQRCACQWGTCRPGLF